MASNTETPGGALLLPASGKVTYSNAELREYKKWLKMYATSHIEVQMRYKNLYNKTKAENANETIKTLYKLIDKIHEIYQDVGQGKPIENKKTQAKGNIETLRTQPINTELNIKFENLKTLERILDAAAQSQGSLATSMGAAARTAMGAATMGAAGAFAGVSAGLKSMTKSVLTPSVIYMATDYFKVNLSEDSKSNNPTYYSDQFNLTIERQNDELKLKAKENIRITNEDGSYSTVEKGAYVDKVKFINDVKKAMKTYYDDKKKEKEKKYNEDKLTNYRILLIQHLIIKYIKLLKGLQLDSLERRDGNGYLIVGHRINRINSNSEILRKLYETRIVIQKYLGANLKNTITVNTIEETNRKLSNAYVPPSTS